VLACALRLSAGEGGPGTPTASEPAVRQAIVEAVKGRMGREADVRIEDVRIGGAAAAADVDTRLVARPEPGARVGRAIRFSLVHPSSGGASRTAGYAVARVYVALEHARAARAIGRGETVGADDIVSARAEVGAVPLQPLPPAAEIVGTRTLRDVSADEVLTRSIVALRQTVQSGDVVSVRVAGEGVTAQTQGVATQSGGPGQTIRVVNPSSRRSVKARVVAPGQVEVVQGDASPRGAPAWRLPPSRSAHIPWRHRRRARRHRSRPRSRPRRTRNSISGTCRRLEPPTPRPARPSDGWRRSAATRGPAR